MDFTQKKKKKKVGEPGFLSPGKQQIKQSYTGFFTATLSPSYAIIHSGPPLELIAKKKVCKTAKTNWLKNSLFFVWPRASLIY